MQVDDIGWSLAHSDPLGGRGAEKSECICIACKRSTRLILMIDTAAAVLREQGVIENDVLYATVFDWDAPDIYGLRATAKVDVDRRQVDGTGQFVQRAVRWRRNRRAPASGRQSKRQVTHDVTDAANLAAGQGAVF